MKFVPIGWRYPCVPEPPGRQRVLRSAVALGVAALPEGLPLVATAALVRSMQRLRPLLLEVATLIYRFSDSVMAKASMKQEDLEDLLADARARARQHAEPSATRGRAQA